MKLTYRLNCSPFVRQHGILNNEWEAVQACRSFFDASTERITPPQSIVLMALT